MMDEKNAWDSDLIEPYIALLGGSEKLFQLRKDAMINKSVETVEIPLPMIFGIKIKAICSIDCREPLREALDKNGDN